LRVVGDWDEWPARRLHPPVTKLVELFLDRWLRRRAWLTVVASSYLAQQFREGYGIDAVYIPYAVFPNDHPDGDSPYSEPTAVYMGNLYPGYDHDLILRAALELKRRGQTPAMTLIGGGPDLSKSRQFTTDNGLTHVTFRGYVDGPDLWQHLRHAHVLLLPIRPTVPNRARCPAKTYSYAQARRPVIASPVGEVPGVLGANATYVDATPGAFADAIADALSVPLPDVDYNAHLQTWQARGAELLRAVVMGTGTA
jgi:glycosyltransferase involved in cell wall biosynthesis